MTKPGLREAEIRFASLAAELRLDDIVAELCQHRDAGRDERDLPPNSAAHDEASGVAGARRDDRRRWWGRLVGRA